MEVVKRSTNKSEPVCLIGANAIPVQNHRVHALNRLNHHPVRRLVFKRFNYINGRNSNIQNCYANGHPNSGNRYVNGHNPVSRFNSNSGGILGPIPNRLVPSSLGQNLACQDTGCLGHYNSRCQFLPRSLRHPSADHGSSASRPFHSMTSGPVSSTGPKCYKSFSDFRLLLSWSIPSLTCHCSVEVHLETDGSRVH